MKKSRKGKFKKSQKKTRKGRGLQLVHYRLTIMVWHPRRWPFFLSPLRVFSGVDGVDVGVGVDEHGEDGEHFAGTKQNISSGRNRHRKK